MSSPKYNKAKGAAFEIDVMKWFRGLGVLAERLRLAGKDDEGDLVVVVIGTDLHTRTQEHGKTRLASVLESKQKLRRLTTLRLVVLEKCHCIML
jgi:hypothetical protein